MRVFNIYDDNSNVKNYIKINQYNIKKIWKILRKKKEKKRSRFIPAFQINYSILKSNCKE